jgi:hypothetical protein
MSRPFFYCSQLSSQFDEHSYGTASRGEVWLLLEYAYPWGPKAFKDSAILPEIKVHIERVLKATPRSRLLLIKRDRVRTGNLSVFVVHSRERNPFTVRMHFDRYEELLEMDASLLASDRIPKSGELLDQPLFLVCTHGRRDKCCAKFGYPLYRFLKASCGGSVWQSSHVGGDRFAANLVCFPHGLFYGRVSEEQGTEILDEYCRGSVVLETYRGRASYSHVTQAAELFVRRESGLIGVDDLLFDGAKRIAENYWRVSFMESGNGAEHVAEIKRSASQFQTYITCHSDHVRNVVQFAMDDYSSKRV